MSVSFLSGVQAHRLSNGLRVFLKEDPRWPLVSTHIWVRAGSIDESPSEAGIAHVLEHMVFKGTARYQAEDIARWIESLGGAMNAETAKEYTHYYMDVPRAGARRAVQLLGEMIGRARLDTTAWALECPVILEEIARRNDDPEVALWDLLQEAVFQEPAHRRSVIGSPETVSALDCRRLRRFYSHHYVASKCVAVLCGDFKSPEVLAWMENDFGGLARGSPALARPNAAPRAVARHLLGKRPVQKTHLAFGFQTPSAVHPDQEALDLIAMILGDGRDARLVRELREKRKLVWTISAINFTHAGPGLFAVFAECDARQAKALPDALSEQWSRLRRRPPSDGEISRAKNLLQTAWLQGFETTHQVASTIGAFAMDDHLQRLRNYLPRILGLTRRQIIDATERYVQGPMSSAVVEA